MFHEVVKIKQLDLNQDCCFFNLLGNQKLRSTAQPALLSLCSEQTQHLLHLAPQFGWQRWIARVMSLGHKSLVMCDFCSTAGAV